MGEVDLHGEDLNKPGLGNSCISLRRKLTSPHERLLFESIDDPSSHLAHDH